MINLLFPQTASMKDSKAPPNKDGFKLRNVPIAQLEMPCRYLIIPENRIARGGGIVSKNQCVTVAYTDGERRLTRRYRG